MNERCHFVINKIILYGEMGKKKKKNGGDDRIKLYVSQIRKEKEEILKPIDYIIAILCFFWLLSYLLTHFTNTINCNYRKPNEFHFLCKVVGKGMKDKHRTVALFVWPFYPFHTILLLLGVSDKNR